MKIIILGASGFIGTRLATSLAREGHEVTAIARANKPADLPDAVSYLQATMDDTGAMESALAEADYLVHCAWDTTPGTSQMQPVLEGANNLLPSLKLLELMQHHPRCRIVFISSGGALFDHTRTSSYAEDSALWPRSYYGAAKIAMEYMLKAYHSQTRNGVFVLRPSNVYGPGQRSKRSFAVIPTIMRCLKHGEPFEIWGTGETVRDYLYTDDFESCVTQLLTRDWTEPVFQIFNVGSGQGVSINALCETLETVTGRALQRQYRTSRTVDSPAVTLDVGKAARELGWTPRTNLHDGLLMTWQWYLGRQ